MPHPRHSTKEIVDRGEELYQSTIRPNVVRENKGRYLAIDIETGEYALADEHLEAADMLLDKRPDAPIYMKLVGYRATAAIGASLGSEDEEAE